MQVVKHLYCYCQTVTKISRLFTYKYILYKLKISWEIQLVYIYIISYHDLYWKQERQNHA